MSTTVREEYEVGDLDPAGCARSRRATAERELRTNEPRSASSSSPPTGPTSTPPPRHRSRDVRWGGPPGRRVTGRRRHTAGGGLHPGTVRVGVGHVPVGRGTADRRRPRPAPPPPPAVEARVPVGGAGLAGPPGRPADPPAPKAAAIWVDEQLADRTSCGPVVVDRLVAQAIAAYDPEEHEDRGERRPGRLGRHPHPPRADGLPRHLPPRSHRRHPGPEDVLRPGLRGSPTSCSSTATPTRSASARSRPSASSPGNP